MKKQASKKLASPHLTFSDKVRMVVRKIPKGKVLTYKQVASKAGSPNAARAVGNIMRNNFDPSVPCHRVIGSDGAMRGYNRGGVKAKEEILKREGAI
jgi:O-6-methylguanine DNA methyltransferase